MTINCVLIDDEPLALEVLKQYIQQFLQLHLMQDFDDVIEGEGFLKNNPVDLLFIDINMPDIKGTELVKGLSPKTMIIFTTAYKNYALEGFELDAIDYLLKAIDFYQFRKSTQTEASSLFVRSEYQLVKIGFNEIEYIESVEDYIKIYVT